MDDKKKSKATEQYGGHRHTESVKINRFVYRLATAVTGTFSRVFFKCKYFRNEIRGKKGPFVVIANHQAAYDFVNLIRATKKPMHFVISESFYETLPVKNVLKRMGVIPKQQFQTSLRDLKKMKTVIDEGKILVIYPAGLMCEDGLSTPIPEATYQFLKWIKADIYMAKTMGTYFAMPKWSMGVRRGKTYMDVYKLFSLEELENMELDEVKARTEEAMLFDAYREQEKLLVKYKHGSKIEGLEKVLYICPNCRSVHTMRVRDKSVICCEKCGFAEQSDEYGFLHKISEVGEEVRYVSDWSKYIHGVVKDTVLRNPDVDISCPSNIYVIDKKKHKFVPAGVADVRLTCNHFHIDGVISGEERSITVATSSFASMPFKPAKYMEIQHNEEIFRCVPKEPRQVMEIVHTVKVLYELHTQANERIVPRHE